MCSFLCLFIRFVYLWCLRGINTPDSESLIWSPKNVWSMNHDTVESIRTHLNKISGKWRLQTHTVNTHKQTLWCASCFCVFSDHYGLISPGLTCYLNSVLQVLFMTEDFRDKIKRFVKTLVVLFYPCNLFKPFLPCALHAAVKT